MCNLPVFEGNYDAPSIQLTHGRESSSGSYTSNIFYVCHIAIKVEAQIIFPDRPFMMTAGFTECLSLLGRLVFREWGRAEQDICYAWRKDAPNDGQNVM